MEKFLIILLFFAHAAFSAEPLRVFIRSGEKTHGPGCHDYPAFLDDWTKLLNERGAKATGANAFPTKEELSKTDVLILHAEEAGNIEGADRENFEAFLERGGGVVAIHGGTVSRDHDWYKNAIGGSWHFGKTKWLEGEMSLYFTDLENPITRGVSNFDLDDEIYYDMDMLPEAKILAAAYTPKPKEGDAEAGKPVNIYDIQPQMWTYETDGRRAFVCVPGHRYENFSHTSILTILLRGIAWAGKMEDADALLTEKPAVESALRYPAGGPTRPEEAAAKIEVHPEFDITLVAAEPLINKAMNLDWDAEGRMWVVESPEYPNGLRKANTAVWKESGSVEPGEYDRDPLDRISILTDTDGDGRMDEKHVFADKLELATGFVFHRNGVIVSAAPNLWFLEDTDGDLVADKRTKLYTGLGTGDTHAVMNNLRWGLDGWIYATHGYSAGDVTALGAAEKGKTRIGSGVVRFLPDGSAIEMYSSKGGNTWGLCMTADGQCFWTQPTSGTVLFHTVLPEYVLAKGKIPGTNGFHGMISGQKTFPLMTWEQAAYKQIDFVGSYTAASGCAIYEGGAWPEKWNDSYFTGEPTINIVSHYFVKPDGVTYTAKKEQGREETEFIRSKDLWFRPIETRVGPDGALYVIDFYNQAVIHNDTRGPLHGPANAAVRPDRDHYFGRIWRIQHKQAKEIDVPAIVETDEASMDAAFNSPNAHTRSTAIRLISESGNMFEVRNGSAALEAYEETIGAGSAEMIRRFAAARDDWTKSALIAAASPHPMETIIGALASDKASEVRELVVNLLPLALKENPSASAAELVTAAGKAPASSDSLKVVILDAIAIVQDAKPALTAPISDALVSLLKVPDAANKVLPLIARWDTKREMSFILKWETKRIDDIIRDPKSSPDEILSAARTYAAMGSFHNLVKIFAIMTDPTMRNDQRSMPMREELVRILGSETGVGILAENFSKIPDDLRGLSFDEIVKRPEGSLALLEAVEKGTLDPKTISPGNISRLRNHPDKSVSEKAASLSEILNPGAKEKAATIAALLPEVRKPGNAEKGKNIFTAACAICHKYDELPSAEVGPALTGMGTHSAEELLVHIIDPNREVDPTFWQWNITTKQGGTLAGVITSENNAVLTLRNQGGDTEIRKSDIASRDNTRRSLMPEGFEALGADNISDIIAYMAAADADHLGAESEREAPELKEFPADSTSATGQRFLEPRKEDGTIRVLLVGAGTSHHFPRDFIAADSATLTKTGADVAGTMNLQEALALMPEADVLVFSGNHEQWGSEAFQKALHDFADAGKGIVLLHAATWSHPWEGYNERFAAGETKAHGKGTVTAMTRSVMEGQTSTESSPSNGVRPAKHPILKGVPESFTIADESYHFKFSTKDGHTTLIENRPDGKSPDRHPALWIVHDPKTRIVAYTHGHDDKSHAHPAFQTILRNAVRWVGSR